MLYQYSYGRVPFHGSTRNTGWFLYRKSIYKRMIQMIQRYPNISGNLHILEVVIQSWSWIMMSWSDTSIVLRWKQLVTSKMKGTRLFWEKRRGWFSHVGKTIINHPPVITIFIGGLFTIPSHGWLKWHCFYPHYIIRVSLIRDAPSSACGEHCVQTLQLWPFIIVITGYFYLVKSSMSMYTWFHGHGYYYPFYKCFFFSNYL